MQRPDPAPDHGSLTKHMALASSRQHGTQPKYPNKPARCSHRLYPMGPHSFRVAFLAEPSMRGKRALISIQLP